MTTNAWRAAALIAALGACESPPKAAHETANHLRVSAAASAALVAASPVAPPIAPAEPAPKVTSFSAAKRLLREIYAEQRTTIYCGCAFDEQLQIDAASCGYLPKRDSKRSRRAEWEHVVPAEAFGQSFAEWREGHPDCVDRRGESFKGRDCARKTSPEFRAMEADMHNLYPAIGEINARRSNFSMAEIEGEERAFGACDVEIADRKIEPRVSVRGDVARTYLYFDAAHPGRGVVSNKNRRLFEAWSEADPVDAWECARARRIAAQGGDPNPLIDAACRQADL